MRRIRFTLTGLLLLIVPSLAISASPPEHEWKGDKWVEAEGGGKGTAAGELGLIRSFAEKGKHAKVVRYAKKFLNRYAGDPLCEEVMMLAGEAELDRERYYQGFQWFNRQLGSYPDGRYHQRALDRELKVAEAFLQGKKRVIGKIIRLPAEDEGLEILFRVAEQSPNSKFARKALLRIADQHYKKFRYLEAVNAYDHFIEMFPKSPRTVYARLQAARSVFASFEGVKREETPLIEAEQRVREFQAEYPDLARRANVSQLLLAIRDLRAEKGYETARFYLRTKHPKAGAFYCREVIRRYPGTEWARKAKQDLERIGPVGSVRPEVSPAVGPAKGSRSPSSDKESESKQ